MKCGRCSACGGEAEQAPSGRWWHINGRACSNRSQTLFWPVVIEKDGTMRSATDAEMPARFIEGAS